MVDAKKVKEKISRVSEKVFSGSKNQAHKQCRICFKPIPLNAEPRVCKSSECVNKNSRDERNQKQMRLWMFIFFGLFAFSFVGPIVLNML
jgi:predicted nucleic acid-binding Zn ribbon protein